MNKLLNNLLFDVKLMR